MTSEYELLRNEIIAWQERRFTVLTGSITLVVVLVGFVLSDRSNRWSSQQAVTLVLSILGCSALLTWYAGWGNAIMGSFLEVFYEGEGGGFYWQKARSLLNERRLFFKYFNLNALFSLIYLVVAGAACAVVGLHCKRESRCWADVAAISSALFFIGAWLLCAFCSQPAARYRQEWILIRNQLQPTNAIMGGKEGVTLD